MADLIEIRIPDEQEEGTTLELAGWLKKVGDTVAQDEAVAEVATDKAVLEIVSPVPGILRELLVEDEAALEPGQPIARVEPTSAATVAEAGPTEVAKPTADAAAIAIVTRHDRPSPHPAILRFAAKHGLDLDTIEGSGHGGRVTRADLESQLGGQVRPTPAPAEPARFGEIAGSSHRIRHDPMRRTIARNMADSVRVAPHVTAVFDCDLSAVMADRRQRKAALADRSIKLTYTAYFLQATVAAIRAVPEVNSRWHDDALEVFDAIHVGVGTALEDRGLVVPVVRDVQSLDLEATAAELTRLTDLARAAKLTPADMQGSTFTISNHGVQGTLIASPIIIRQPESAILGVGKVEDRAVVVDGQVVVKPKMYVTLTIDHRALDAFHTNRFLQTFCGVIEGWGQT